MEDTDQPNHEIDVLSGHENDVNYVQFRLVYSARYIILLYEFFACWCFHYLFWSGCAVASRFSTTETWKEENVPKFKNSWCVWSRIWNDLTPIMLLLSFASHKKCHISSSQCFGYLIYLNGYISRLNHDNIVTCSRDGSAIIWIPKSRRSHVSFSNIFSYRCFQPSPLRAVLPTLLFKLQNIIWLLTNELYLF